MGNKPDARGSKAPVCPAFSALNNQRTFCNAAFELIPKGLFNKNTP